MTAVVPEVGDVGGGEFVDAQREGQEALHDESLPPGTAGLVLPGGFPECDADTLSANAALRVDVAALARRGAPAHAQCGGLL